MYVSESVAYRGFEGTGSQTIDYDVILHELMVYNDSATETLSVTVCTRSRDHDTFVIPPGEAFDERVMRFCRLKFTANGPYHGCVRRGDDVFWDASYLDN